MSRLSALGESCWDDAYPMLPVQFAETAREGSVHQPERRLMLAVLSDAIVALQRRGARIPGFTRGHHDEAVRWLLSDDRRWPCSFVNVCEALGLEPEPIRRAALALRLGFARGTTRPTARRRILAGRRVAPFAETG